MSQIHITKNGEESAFSKPLKRALLRDKRLSYGARGLFAMLWDYPSNWTYHLSNIVEMSPNGMFQLKRYINELKVVGAISILPRRLDDDEAKAKSESTAKQYKAGQLSGWNWILNHPDLWAIEALLAKNSPKDRFSDIREIQLADIPPDGQSTTKGLKQNGSSIKELPPQKSEENTDDALIFPKQLSSKERDSAAQVLINLDATRAQELLDELAARINANAIKSSAIGYLRSLVNRHQEGKFVPELGIKVEAARKNALVESKRKSEPSNLTKPEDIPQKLASIHSALGLKTKNSNQEKVSHE
jgi:hypothetical protein